jgi:hypothetical protein
MERRRHLRLKIRFDTLYSAGPNEGAGVLTEISYTGARIEEVMNPPKEGTLVRIYIFIQPVAPFEVAGHVARVDENSFAIHYDNFDDDVRRLVEDVSAIVGGSGAE